MINLIPGPSPEEKGASPTPLGVKIMQVTQPLRTIMKLIVFKMTFDY